MAGKLEKQPIFQNGDFFLRALYVSGVKLVSEPISIKVVSPPDGKEKQVLNLLRDPHFLYFLQLGRFPQGQEEYVLEKCKNLSIKFADSRYLQFSLIKERLDAVQGRSSTDNQTNHSPSQTPFFTVRDLIIGIVAVGLSVYLAVHIRKRRSSKS